MANQFAHGRIPWWNGRGNRPEKIAQLSCGMLGMRVRLASGDRVTMPLGLATFVLRDPQ
jgi:hypothetical protein